MPKATKTDLEARARQAIEDDEPWLHDVADAMEPAQIYENVLQVTRPPAGHESSTGRDITDRIANAQGVQMDNTIKVRVRAIRARVYVDDTITCVILAGTTGTVDAAERNKIRTSGGDSLGCANPHQAGLHVWWDAAILNATADSPRTIADSWEEENVPPDAVEVIGIRPTTKFVSRPLPAESPWHNVAARLPDSNSPVFGYVPRPEGSPYAESAGIYRCNYRHRNGKVVGRYWVDCYGKPLLKGETVVCWKRIDHPELPEEV